MPLMHINDLSIYFLRFPFFVLFSVPTLLSPFPWVLMMDVYQQARVKGLLMMCYDIRMSATNCYFLFCCWVRFCSSRFAANITYYLRPHVYTPFGVDGSG